MRQLSSLWIYSYTWFLLCIHPSKILKKYCTCLKKKKNWKWIAVPPELNLNIKVWSSLSSLLSEWHCENSPWHKLLSWPLCPSLGENGSSVSHRLMFNKEVFVLATDQEFSWTMTLDGPDPLPGKQWFCFKFLLKICALRLLQPTEQSHETRLKTQLQSRRFCSCLNVR